MQSSESGRRTFRSRLNEMVEQLREGIAAGIYKNGSYLPTEKALAKQFRLSNKTVRKGLEQLTAEGLIEKIPRVGSVVIAKPDAAFSVSPAPATVMLGCSSPHEKELILPRLVEDFHTLFPSIRVETVGLPTAAGFLPTLQACLDNALIDVFTIKDRLFREIVEAGGIEALEPRPANGPYYTFLNDTFTEGNVLYAQPLVFSPLVMAYNLRHFREAGVTEPDASWTWAETVAQAERLSVPGQRYGLHFNVLLDERWPLFLLQGGNEHAAESGSVERWLEGVRLCKTIIRNHTIFPDRLYGSDRDVGTLFLQGRTSMIVTGYESLNRFANSELEYDISSVPYMNSPRTLLSVTGVAVNKRSNRKAEARCFADYLSSPRAQKLLREHTLSIPALKPAAEAPPTDSQPLNRPSRFQLYRDIIPGFRQYDDLRLPTGAIRPLHETLKNYWADLLDEQALREQVEAILAGRPVPALGT